MFEDLIAIYHLKGAKPEFYRALPEADPADFTPWLSVSRLKEINEKWLFLEEEPFSALCLAAEKTAAHPGLCALAASARSLLFDCGYSVDYLTYLGFPRPETEDSPVNDFFGLLVHLSGISEVEKRYRSRNIPLSFMRQSYRSVYIWIHSFRRFTGRWGHNRECPRMIFIENFRFLRIGRLEYEMDRFYGKILVLKNRNGKTAALSEGDVLVNPDGLVTNTNGNWDPHCRRTEFRETGEAYYGQEISGGRISDTTACYCKKEWSPLIRRGEKCINVHIPGDGRLVPAEAKESLAEAAEFFRTYFPEWSFPVFQCHSWLLDDTLAVLLGEDANIPRFQQLFTRFPEESTDFGAMISIFTEEPFELASWVPVSSLQRKVQEFYRNGGKLRNAGGFCLPEQPL